MLELPVHWSLDDWPHLHWKPGRGDAFTAPEDFLATWLAEFDSAHEERRHVTFTMHPEVIGRGYRAQLLDRLIEQIKQRGNVWFGSHGDVAAWVVA
jgi:peptidoglycan/xylan/chitin deacetylase (PgdA/CDA1 family)